MHSLSFRKTVRVLVMILAVSVARSLTASELEITVTNNQPRGGFAIAPVWIGIHDGTFTTFTPGSCCLLGH